MSVLRCVLRRPIIPESKATRIHSGDWGGEAAQVFCMARQTSPISDGIHNTPIGGLFLRKKKKKRPANICMLWEEPPCRRQTLHEAVLLVASRRTVPYKVHYSPLWSVSQFHPSLIPKRRPPSSSLLTSCRFLLVFFRRGLSAVSVESAHPSSAH